MRSSGGSGRRDAWSCQPRRTLAESAPWVAAARGTWRSDDQALRHFGTFRKRECRLELRDPDSPVQHCPVDSPQPEPKQPPPHPKRTTTADIGTSLWPVPATFWDTELVKHLIPAFLVLIISWSMCYIVCSDVQRLL